MVTEYKFSFNELDINKEDIEELLGFENGNVPEPFTDFIEKGLAEAPQHCNIRGGLKIFDNLQVDQQNGIIKIDNQLFQPAKIVSIQLKNAKSIALFVCTAGSEITDYSKVADKQGDQMYSYVLDVIGSVIVEKAMDEIQKKLEDDMKLNGLGISDRFSPGYCDWNVSDQHKLFRLLPENFCGIRLSESSLMNPIKSVSGIIGLGENLKQLGYQCHWCNDPNCIYGKTKRKKIAKKNA